MTTRNLISLLFCLISTLAIAQSVPEVSSTLRPIGLRVETDFLNYSSLNLTQLQLNQQSKFAILDVSNPSFLLSESSSPNLSTLAQINTHEMLVKRVTSSPSSNTSTTTRMDSYGIQWHEKDENEGVSNFWFMNDYIVEDTMHLGLGIGEDLGDISFTQQHLNFEIEKRFSGNKFRMGISTFNPKYTLDISHHLSTAGNIWTDGNGFSLHNFGSNGNRWVHYVVNSNGDYIFATDGEIRAKIDSDTGNWVPVPPPPPENARSKKQVKTIQSDILQKIKYLNPTITQIKNQRKGRKYYGLNAKEVQQIFPDIVLPIGEEQKVLGISYTELIPILIAGMQEQQTDLEKKEQYLETMESDISELKAEMETLKSLLADFANQKETPKKITTHLSDAKLFQNAPNPFSSSTEIAYYLPEKTVDAKLKISNINGQLIKTLPLPQTGKGSIALDTHLLSRGTYQYSLWIKGQLIETHQMVLIKQ